VSYRNWFVAFLAGALAGLGSGYALNLHDTAAKEDQVQELRDEVKTWKSSAQAAWRYIHSLESPLTSPASVLPPTPAD
jgi:hypothetical protein